MDDVVDEVVLTDRGAVLALIPDLFFSVTVRNTIRRLGFSPMILRTADELLDEAGTQRPVLAVVDVAAVRLDSDWETITDVIDAGVPVLVFGAHKDVDGLRNAKAARVTRVVSNGQFHREMPDLIQRYALAPSCPARSVEPADDDDLVLGSLPPGMAESHSSTVSSSDGVKQ